MYDQRWVVDRFVPAPRTGYRWATFLLARPFADQTEELIRRWSELPGCCLLWQGGEHLIAVVLSSGSPPPSGRPSSWTPSRLGKEALSLSCDLYAPEVPVYFDFEGAVANLLERPCSSAYPRSLGTGEPPGPPPSPGLLRKLRTIVEKPLLPVPEDVFRQFQGPLSLTRSQRWLLEKGWASWRVFPDLGALPPKDGRTARRFAFLWGTLRTGKSADELFHALRRQSRVAPFLLAGHEGKLLLGAVGTGAPAGASPSTGEADRRPVTEVLAQHATGIESLSLSLSDLKVLRDHRYDALDAFQAHPA